jgi:cell division protein FtsQ
VRVANDGTLTRDQVLAASGIVVGANIFTCDLKKVRLAIEHLPQVEHVDVRRRLPHRIDIEIMERQPIAWVTERSDIDPTSSESSLLIDSRGYVMRSRKIPHEYFNLPTISGVVTENLAPGQKVNTLEMQAALDLIRLNADSTRWQVRNIDLAKGYCLIVTDRTHAQITFGLDDVDRQLSRLNRLLDYLEPMHKEIQTVNLLVDRNIPVTFVDPEAPVAEAPASTAPPAPAGKTDKSSNEKSAPKQDSKEKAKSSGKRTDGSPAPKAKANSGGKPLPEGVRKPFSMHG